MCIQEIFRSSHTLGTCRPPTVIHIFVLVYCITPIFRVEEIFAIFANLDFVRNFPPAKIISTANGISRNFPPAKFSSPRKYNSNSSLSLYTMQQQHFHIANRRSSLIVGITGIRNVVKPSGLIRPTFFWANHFIACYAARIVKKTWCGVSVAKLGFMLRVPVASHRSYNATCVNSRRTMFATCCFSAINFHC